MDAERQGRQPFTIKQKREALSAWYDELAKGPDSGLPTDFVKAYRKSQAGFTDDVMDRAMLDLPPVGVVD